VDELIVLTDLATGYIAYHGPLDDKTYFTVHKFHEMVGIALGEGMLEREKSWRDATNPSNRK